MCKKCCQGEPKDGMKDINRNRSITDALWFLVFVVFVFVVVICSIVGAASGNAASLFYGTDYSGNTCGSANLNVAEATRKDKLNMPYIVYPRLSEDMINQAATLATDPTSLKFFGICATKCPASESWICTDEVDTAKATDTKLNDCKKAAGGGQFLSKFSYGGGANADCSALMQNCYQLPTGSTDILFRCLYQYNTTVLAGKKMCTDPPNVLATDDKCVKTVQVAQTTKEEPSKEDLIAKQMSSATALFTSYIADVVNAGPTILVVGALGAAVCGFLFLILMRYFAGFFVWMAIWLLFLVLVVASLYSFVMAGILNVSSVVSATTGVRNRWPTPCRQSVAPFLL